MKKAKMAFWLILIAFLALLTYQNWDFFMSQHGLRINLLVVDYNTPELQNAILFLIFFFAGLLISYFFSLFERFKTQRSIKSLTSSLEMCQKLLDELKKENQSLKSVPPADIDSGISTESHETKDSNVS
jgi:Zn-dependent protease with chaperone function